MPSFRVWIANRRWIRHPEIDLERTPTLAANSSVQVRIDSGVIRSAPQAPIPPAFATATDRDGGHAPAIGASRIGRRIDILLAKASALERGFVTLRLFIYPFCPVFFGKKNGAFYPEGIVRQTGNLNVAVSRNFGISGSSS